MTFSFCFRWLKIGIKSQFRVYLGIDYQIVYCCQEIEGKISIRTSDNMHSVWTIQSTLQSASKRLYRVLCILAS